MLCAVSCSYHRRCTNVEVRQSMVVQIANMSRFGSVILLFPALVTLVRLHTCCCNPAGFKTPKGYSKVEPLIPSTRPGFVGGYTNVANTGANSTGYAPATDIVMCWETYADAAKQAADSRLYGGIHIRADNEDGLTLGTRIGQSVAAVTGMLLPINPANTGAACCQKGDLPVYSVHM